VNVLRWRQSGRRLRRSLLQLLEPHRGTRREHELLEAMDEAGAIAVDRLDLVVKPCYPPIGGRGGCPTHDVTPSAFTSS
jgi:hypothetical protein